MAVLLLAEVTGGELMLDATAKAMTAAAKLGDVTVLCAGASAAAAGEAAAAIASCNSGNRRARELGLVGPPESERARHAAKGIARLSGARRIAIPILQHVRSGAPGSLSCGAIGQARQMIRAPAASSFKSAGNEFLRAPDALAGRAGRPVPAIKSGIAFRPR